VLRIGLAVLAIEAIGAVLSNGMAPLADADRSHA